MIRRSKKGHKDNLTYTITDWLILGLTTAYRGIEWCQPDNPEGDKKGKKRGLQKYRQPVEFTSNMVYAKCWEDWKFFDIHKKEIKDPLNTNVSKIAYSSDWYRFQKVLKNNNTYVLYKLAHKDPQWCPTQAKLCILRHHKELGMRKDQPLAVYRKQAGSQRGTYMIKKGVIERINTA